MTDRHEAILRLLDTRFDNLPDALGISTTVALRGVTSGFVHRTLASVVCPTCEGVDDRCTTCRGRGFIEKRREVDPMSRAEGSVVPAQMRAVAPYGVMSMTKLGHVPARDAEIARLAVQTREHPATELDLLADANANPEPWEQARRRMYERFDYAALEVAVDELHKTHPGVSARSMRGLEFIDVRMPDPIRAPGALVTSESVQGTAVERDPRAERDARILHLAAVEKRPAAEIAVEVRCSLKTVYRVLERAA